MSEGMSSGKLSGAKMSKEMTEYFRINRLGELSDGINLTDDYKTSLWINRPLANGRNGPDH